jgi:hypothetical protein
VQQELPNILALLRAAQARGFHDQVWQIVEALWGFFIYRKNYTDWIASHELGVASALAVMNERAEQKMLRALATAYMNLHRFQEAAVLLERALDLAEVVDYPEGAVGQCGRFCRGVFFLRVRRGLEPRRV